MKHIIAAFIFAPVIPFLPFLIVPPIFIVVLAFGAVIVYPAAIFLGLPLFLWVKRKPHLQRASVYAFGGGLIGFLAVIVVYLVLRGESDKISGDGSTVWIWPILHGAASGYVFWRYVRPIMKPKILKPNEALPHAKTH